MKKADKERQRVNVNSMLYKAISQTAYIKNLERNLKANNVKEIAIYGAGKVGRELGVLLKEKNFVLSYYVDKFSGESNMNGVPIFHVRTDYLQDVDCLIVTPCYEKYFILKEIENYYSDKCKIIFLDELLEVQI